MKPLPRVRRIALRLLLLLAGLATVEAAARVATVLWPIPNRRRPPAERAHTGHDAELGWVNKRSHVVRDLYGPGLTLTTNAQGFRNQREFPRAVPAGKTRVVCLGDSFTLGYGVGDADSWPAQMEQACPDLETPNMGQGGYGIDQAYLWWMRDGGAIDHQVLVLAFIAGDFDRMRWRAFQGYGKPVLRLAGDKLATDNVPVPEDSYRTSAIERLAGAVRTVGVVKHLLDRAGDGHATDTDHLSQSETGRVADALFTHLAAECQRRGTTLVLVHLPRLTPGQPSRLLELPPYAKAALAQAVSRKIPFIDLTPEFDAIPDARRRTLFIPRDDNPRAYVGAAGHYSAAGNDFVAHALAKRMTDLGLIPASACRSETR